ncbi:MAG: lysophospholipase [Leptolyngbya sp. SIO4C1]|nr:lysophospholipase [Leptolyngbya sp. SIO4C1]
MSRSVVNRILKIPNWAALSLLMNAVLFMTLIATWQKDTDVGEPMLPQANAADVTTPLESALLSTAVARPQGLTYQEWVQLLDKQMQAMTAKHPDHLTILLGDSLSLWFPPELLPGRRVWMNQAISGEKTQGLLARLHLFDRAEVDTIFLMIGINDLIWGQSDDQIIRNYREIMQYLSRYHPTTKVVVQSILPHGAETATWESRDRLLALPNSRVRAMNQSLQVVADDYDAYYMDLYPIFSNGEGNLRPDLSTDGLHLNREGYLVWRAAIAMYSQVELQ